MLRILRWIGYLGVGLAVLVALLFLYLSWCSRVTEPAPHDRSATRLEPQGNDTVLVTIGNNWLRKSSSGLWEMYVEGAPFDRGVINGKLSKALIYEQESAFSEQIERLVPSAFYRSFLKYFIGWFNRDLEHHITEEYKMEIYGVSRSASDEFDYIGAPYQRLMNYHAAHDIGHALQNLALVGCTSFATWDTASENNQLILGRNFDFYVGDRFAENKIVLFEKPDSGNAFMMVTWGGMIGTVSGMNVKGLTVTLNAARSDVPGGSATPISLLAREVLQYASNLKEAIAIAKSRQVFVSESFLVGSAADGKAISIEITPDTVSVFVPEGDRLICSNHYQSEALTGQALNAEQMRESASVYRGDRLNQLLDSAGTNTPEKTASMLRNLYGMNGAHIGYGNEKAVNQMISHHAIIFEPYQRKVWVSTAPWNLGPFVCYQLDSIFAMKGMHTNHEIADTLEAIPADPFIETDAFRKFLLFRRYKQDVMQGRDTDPDAVVASNPDSYDAWMTAGNICYLKKQYARAIAYYETALTKEIATLHEERFIRERIRECKTKSRSTN